METQALGWAGNTTGFPEQSLPLKYSRAGSAPLRRRDSRTVAVGSFRGSVKVLSLSPLFCQLSAAARIPSLPSARRAGGGNDNELEAGLQMRHGLVHRDCARSGFALAIYRYPSRIECQLTRGDVAVLPGQGRDRVEQQAAQGQCHHDSTYYDEDALHTASQSAKTS